MPDLEAVLNLDTRAAEAAVARIGAALDQVMAKARDTDALVASAVGPAVAVDLNPVEAAPQLVSLLSSAIDVTAALDAEYGPGMWLNGITFEPEGAALDLAADYPYFWQCPEGTTPAQLDARAWATNSPGGVKQIPDKPATVTWRPYTAHTADPCVSTFGMFGRDAPGRAKRLLEANLSRIVENELWTGTRATSAGFPNDFLLNTPTVLNGGAATGYVSALVELEQGYFDRDNRPGFIHAQPRLVQLWLRNQLVTPSPSGRQLRTPLGTTIVPGVGYPGSGTGIAAGNHAGSWAYATGPVMVARTPTREQTTIEADRITRTIDDRVVRAETDIIAMWDSKVRIGIRVDHLTELS